MRESAAPARRLGVRLHTHLAETADDERFRQARFGMRPLELMEELGWLGDDVWFAHGIHLSSSEIERLAESGTGVVHCPSSNMRLGAGACPVEDLVRACVPVGLGVDGAASNEDGNPAGRSTRPSSWPGCAPPFWAATTPATALDGRQAWSLGWKGGAACLGREDCGTLEPGKCADLAAFRIDDLSHVGIEDPLQAVALAPPARAEAVLVNGRVVVRDGRLETADEDSVKAGLALACRRLREAVHA